MKLLLCPTCWDVVRVRPEPRSCHCGATSARYIDNENVEQTEGSISIALHNHDLKTALDVFAHDPSVWNPLMVFRAYINPHSETDVRYLPVEGGGTEPAGVALPDAAESSERSGTDREPEGS